MSTSGQRTRLSPAATLLIAILVAGAMYLGAYKGAPYLIVALPSQLGDPLSSGYAMLFYPLRKHTENRRPPKVWTVRMHEVRSGNVLVARHLDPTFPGLFIFEFDSSQAASVSSLRKGDLIEITFVWRPRFRYNQNEWWLISIVKKGETPPTK